MFHTDDLIGVRRNTLVCNLCMLFFDDLLVFVYTKVYCISHAYVFLHDMCIRFEYVLLIFYRRLPRQRPVYSPRTRDTAHTLHRESSEVDTNAR